MFDSNAPYVLINHLNEAEKLLDSNRFAIATTVEVKERERERERDRERDRHREQAE